MKSKKTNKVEEGKQGGNGTGILDEVELQRNRGRKSLEKIQDPAQRRVETYVRELEVEQIDRSLKRS